MKQIAFFTTDWNYELVGETLRGVKAYLEQHPDVNVRVFDCFGIDTDTIVDPLVYRIYRLADLEKYDGVVLQTHQIVNREEVDQLYGKVREAGIPAVTIGVPLGDLPLVRTDDFHAFHRIVSHLVRQHGVRRLWFLKGLEQFDSSETGEARQRRDGFTAACRDLGIPGEEIRYLEGDWKTASGEAAARELLSLPEEDRPEALVCANDDMALGVISVLQAAGVRVPEQIRVTGFDGIFSASLCSPRLSTMDRHFQSVGFRAMETVMNLIAGQEVPRVIYNAVRESFAGTCGCRTDEQKEMNRLRDRFYQQTQFLRQFYLTQDKLAGAFFASESLEEVMDAAEKYSDIFGGGFLRIYLDERYYRSMKGLTSAEEEEALADGNFSERFVMVADSRRRTALSGERQTIAVGDTQYRLREGISAENRLFQYYALRYGSIMVGVLMLRGLCAAADLNLHESIINELTLSLETIRQRLQLRRANEALNNLYVTDQLTGLNNRFGIARFGRPLFNRLTAEGHGVAFLFVDVDEMKMINDRCGHEAGDEALRATAEVLRRACDPGDFIMRYGGDEFVAFGPLGRTDRAGRVAGILEEVRKERNISFPLNLSTGMYVYRPDGAKSLDECLREADMKMYEIKKKKKPQEPA